jgi:hypothetical protein
MMKQQFQGTEYFETKPCFMGQAISATEVVEMIEQDVW